MNTKQYMVIAKDKIITKNVVSVRYDPTIKKSVVKFTNGQEFKYNFNNVKLLKSPIMLSPDLYQMVRAGVVFSNVKNIYKFTDKQGASYYHVCFSNGKEVDYTENDIKIKQSCLSNAKSNSVFEYFKTLSTIVSMKTDDGKTLLGKQFEKLSFIDGESALAAYLNPTATDMKKDINSTPIFPFGCNASQFKAVKQALDNKLSVIEGPPGTGKTQTILNIIANLLICNKTIAVVSNNNSATENIFEKMAKNDMDFIVASLGNNDNKANFISNQNGEYPDINSWKNNDFSGLEFFVELHKRSEQLGEIFEKQERVAIVKQELKAIKLEFSYFNEYEKETERESSDIKMRASISSDKIMHLWQEFNFLFENKPKISILYKLKLFAFYGISDWRFLNDDLEKINTFMQSTYYIKRLGELQTELNSLENALAMCSSDKLSRELQGMSLAFLKTRLYDKYGSKTARKVFTGDELYKNSAEFQKEYPIVLSTTFSTRTSLSPNAMFDYLIMDEASQVDIVAGVLSLSMARNAVVVGDTKQLANIIDKELEEKHPAIFAKYNIKDGYNFVENSFLKSICSVIPNVPKTLLREHYRCHPKIINFCNQKFYDNQLIIMTNDEDEDNVISVVKTVQGFHSRNHMSQRQIDIIKEDVLPKIKCPDDEIGIIAPYNNQVGEITKCLSGRKIDIATVHKFQGREKDAIIMSTVDDEITDFTDNPYLLNVAVSRAKNQLHLVISGNEFQKDGNIKDLISYIEYNNFEIENSNIYSIFDYLYSHYSEARTKYLKKYSTISNYDSENLMHTLICDVLKDERFKTLKVAIRQQMNMLIRDPKLLDDRETAYAMNNWTHLDFLIYNSISKQPVLAIEVDGYNYHKQGTKQFERDRMKEHILELYKIPLIRFATNGSGEREKLAEKLKIVLGE